MRSLLQKRVTGRHAEPCQALIGGLLEASRRPEEAFEIVERLLDRDPALGQRLVRAANTAARRGYARVTTVRAALVRLGMVRASRILLEDAQRASPTVWRHAA